MARNPHTWTAEQAHAMALKSAESRRERAKLRALAPAASIPPNSPTLSGPDFAGVTLLRVRAQIDRLLTRLAEHLDRKSIDGQQVRYLSGALSDLAELERVLAGRPLPGSRRPSSAEPARPPAPIISRPTIAQPEAPPPALAEPPEW